MCFFGFGFGVCEREGEQERAGGDVSMEISINFVEKSKAIALQFLADFNGCNLIFEGDLLQYTWIFSIISKFQRN